MTKKEENARQLFANGYNCAQSVFASFCEEYGMDKNLALKIANGLGGGIRNGEVCGAVSGAVLAIGLKYGFYIERDIEQKNLCNAKAIEFVNKFKGENGSILCRDLLGIDIRAPEDFLTPEAKESVKKVCPEMVAAAVRALESMGF